MWRAIVHMAIHLADALLDIASSVGAALGVRWLLGYSTPQRDMSALQHWWHDVCRWFVLPDPFEGVNLSYLTALRARYYEAVLRDTQERRTTETVKTLLARLEGLKEGGCTPNVDPPDAD